MSANPSIKAHTPDKRCFPFRSGSISSATTNIIVPAEKDNSQGCKNRKYVTQKKPNTAKIGSTTPLPAPYKKAFRLLWNTYLKGNATAAPSGQFCTPIPIASKSADVYAACVFKAYATPNANPTASPSGILCNVTERKSLSLFWIPSLPHQAFYKE